MGTHHTDHLDALAYAETTDDTYAAAAARTFSVQRPSKGFTLLNGPCPRCRAALSVPLVSDVLRQAGPRRRRTWRIRLRRTGRDALRPYDTVRCNCRLPHPGRPEGRRGCGAYWNLRVLPPQDRP
ncbi:hypothetical protein [Streptomyces sp. NPDC101206]|uniref:hypothetical protein n=1 Tax=Streptomyces sp. NPDC101206 TaxID=3366128 RepID=UPI0037F23733